METQLSLLSHIGYIPSYKPKNPRPVPKLLEDTEAWKKLVDDVEEYIKSSKAKNRGNGVVKPFSITIIDTSGPVPKEAATKKKKATEANTGEFDEGEGTGELKDHELLQLVEKEHHCASCDKACIVLNSGDHYTLSNADLATWVVLLKRHKATISEPPAELKLDISRQRSAKKTLAAKVESSSEPPAWMQPLMMMFGAQALQFQSLRNAPAAVTDHTLVYPPFPQQPAPAGPLPTSQKRSADLFDVEPEDSLELVSWLESLDTDPVRGKFNLNYAQYGPILGTHGFLEVNDLIDLTSDKLAELGGMTWGTANRILKFALADHQKTVERAKRIRFN
ncbi:hypothetical protein M378DRAFT_90510 [Amanita muscaria Koide BX008]|uniref:SAM domain-containing protein n=1 Tax=Amanita muscaria (strain Koide BX008) TaxID=946122 RepID=A0A0C2W3K9_AMAMK|nr:hypothetical protein M378DRAFT_90510 [Amanita muscaria Koide BX008]